MKAEAWPRAGTVIVAVVHRGDGPRGPRHGNPASGWGVYHLVPSGPGPGRPLFTHRKSAVCQRWAEFEFENISGWKRIRADTFAAEVAP